jgi:hypothetical protein
MTDRPITTGMILGALILATGFLIGRLLFG